MRNGRANAVSRRRGVIGENSAPLSTEFHFKGGQAKLCRSSLPNCRQGAEMMADRHRRFTVMRSHGFNLDQFFLRLLGFRSKKRIPARLRGGQLYNHLSHHICRITFAAADTAWCDLVEAL